MLVLPCRYLYKKLTLYRLLAAILCIVVLYNEYLSYVMHRWTWNVPAPRHFPKHNKATRLLLVADPQIIGYQDEPAVIGPITRWDADRYLHKTFTLARDAFSPDVVIFLGDIIDEGSKATSDEYISYVSRIANIFYTTAETLYIPGDNDIGGEGFDLREDWKEMRFDSFFSNYTKVVTYPHMHIIKLDGAVLENARAHVPQLQALATQLNSNNARSHSTTSNSSHSRIRILLSHFTFATQYMEDYYTVIEILQPHFVLSAHNHIARLFSIKPHRPTKLNADSKTNKHMEALRTDDYTVRRLTVQHSLYSDTADVDNGENGDDDDDDNNIGDNVIYELSVPTCSYRMGVPDMAYVAMLIDQHPSMGEDDVDATAINNPDDVVPAINSADVIIHDVSFSLLWLPSRYQQLTLYVATLIVCSVVTLFWGLVRTFNNSRNISLCPLCVLCGLRS